ncbi:MAG: hypothetical protein J7M32_10550 [Deltaproteobacteria bacterium]|nr:hypothetical protein [Deltaproteobacteria bacterium]
MNMAAAQILRGPFFLAGCSERPYREDKIRYQHPQWVEAVIQSIAKWKPEPGMISKMVRAAP